MELVERISLDRIHFLNSLNFKQFKELEICKSSCKNDDDRKTQFSIMKSFCETNIKTRGETKRIYSFTEKTPLEVGGRLYCGNSIQGLSSKIRGFLLKDITTDIDMKNAHPVILRYLCKLHNIECPNLSYYVENRNSILERLGKDYKTEFLKAVNTDKTNKKAKDDYFKAFDKECKFIQQQITSLDCYKHIVNSVPSTREYNWLGSAINRILCVYENKIVQEVISVLNSKQIEICALMFDGLMVYGNIYNDANLLNEIETFVNTKFDGLKIEFSYKEHNESIQIPIDFQVENKIKPLEKSFEKVCEEFEKIHCKITNKGIFIKQLDNDNVVMSKQHIRTSYEQLVYEKYDKDNNIKQMNFVNDWLINNPSQRCYEDIGIYPNHNLCPHNHFNMWRKFTMEMVTEYEYKKESLDIILNHIRILCNNDDKVYDYFVAWIAQMVQYPEVKSTCPTLISKEGAGKGTLMRLFEKMLGDAKIFQTTTPSRDVWGEFNNHMANSFLVNLDELSKKETLESEGKIKGLISEPKMTINNKGVNKFDIQSYHRFIITTNNEEPIKTTSDDRRKFIIRSSDEKCGDVEYFKKLYELLDDVDVVKTCYEYFKSIPNMENFKSIPLPVTEYQAELKELSKSPIESWLEHFTFQNQERDFVELKSSSVYEKFSDWCIENGLEFKIDTLKLMVRISRLNIDGIEKRKSTHGVRCCKFDIIKMKKYFKIGCLL